MKEIKKMFRMTLLGCFLRGGLTDLKMTDIVRTSFGVVAQLVRVSACHAEGRGFEPRPLRQDSNLMLFCAT